MLDNMHMEIKIYLRTFPLKLTKYAKYEFSKHNIVYLAWISRLVCRSTINRKHTEQYTTTSEP